MSLKEEMRGEKSKLANAYACMNNVSVLIRGREVAIARDRELGRRKGCGRRCRRGGRA